MSAAPAIAVEDLHFSYPNGHAVLSGTSFSILPGEKVALIGPNGAGKSTLLSHLIGVLFPSSGTIAVDGIPVAPSTVRAVRQRAGVVFQNPNDQLFCPSVFEDVAFGPLNMGTSTKEVRPRVAEALSLVGLDGFEQRSSFHLSFGERKRLALATVLSCEPEILIFDEPSSNLDPRGRRNLVDWMRRYDRTLVLVTHELDIALEVCDRCLLLAEGRIISDGSAEDVLYDKTLLERYDLEMPSGPQTMYQLGRCLNDCDMPPGERRVIADFLHSHWHDHDTEMAERRVDGVAGGHVHAHVHGGARDEHGHDH